jgi:hypothetical protein
VNRLLLETLASYIKLVADDPDIRIIRDSQLGADEPMSQQTEPEISKAQIVEGESLGAHYVGDDSGFTGFTHFLDGIERTYVPFIYSDLVPVMYGFKAAVIRERGVDKKLSSWQSGTEEALHFPFSLVNPGRMIELGMNVYDTQKVMKDPSEGPPLHPMMLRDLARKSINRRREELERTLSDRWMKQFSGSNCWLLVDGSITASYDIYEHPQVVGVIKSHQTQYFTFEEQRRILNLKPGERSSVFEPSSRKRTPVYSWYLRLRPNAGQDAHFGLIRVEAAKSKATLDLADEISRWLMTERQPLSLPDGRWDKLLYPIRDCEQYLRSIAPSKVVMEAVLSGI